MAPNLRSRHIRGPMGAIINHLLDFQWVPRSPTAWDPPGDTSWEFPDCNFTGVEAIDMASFSDFLDEVKDAAMAPFWLGAEQHFDGEGLRYGTDSFSYRRLLAHLAQVRPAGKRLAGIMLSVAIGGSWTKARKVDQYIKPMDQYAR
eukprot:4689659-Pyramimonas_sp.AAC.1